MKPAKQEMIDLLETTAAESGLNNRYQLADQAPDTMLRAIEEQAFGGDREAAAQHLADVIMPKVAPGEAGP